MNKIKINRKFMIVKNNTTMKHRIKFYALCMLLPIIFISCSGPPDSDDKTPCDQKPIYYRYIDAPYKSYIPYTGLDTLTFVRSLTNDTHTFVGQGLATGFSNSGYYEEDCYIKAKLEFLQHRFISSTFSTPIILSVYVSDPLTSFKVLINLNNQNFDSGLSRLGKPYSLELKSIRGKDYPNIDRFSTFNYPTDTSYYVCYNETSGIVQFKFPNGEYWDLIDN